jgi:hypothetical protein
MSRVSLGGVRVSSGLIIAASLLAQSTTALSGPFPTTGPRGNDGRLIEGRAVYEAQVNFGGARENNLGPDWDFGVPPRSQAETDNLDKSR